VTVVTGSAIIPPPVHHLHFNGRFQG